MKKTKQIPIIFWIFILIFLFRIGYYSISFDYTICTDTFSYMQWYQGDIITGKIDEFRTPVYPYLIKMLQLFSNNQNELCKAVVVFQELLSFASVIIFYITSKHIFNNRFFSYVATILYGTLPIFLSYNVCLLTESLSISLFMMFLCLLIFYFKQPDTKKNVAIAVFTLLLIMLRPSFLFITIFLFLMWIIKLIFEKDNRKQAVVGLILLVSVLGVVCLYSYQNLKQNEFFGLSSVTIINDLDTIIGMGIYDTHLEEDKPIIKEIEKTKETHNGPWYRLTTNTLLKTFEKEEIIDYCNRCKQKYLQDYITNKIEQIKTIASENINVYYNKLKISNDNKSDIYIPFGLIYVFIILELCITLYEWVKKRQDFWLSFTILMLVTGQLMVIIIGAQAEWQRLIVPVIAFVIISIIRRIEMIKNYCVKRKETI